MLPRVHRLRRDSDIKNVVRAGRFFLVSCVKVYFLANNNSGTRVACVCGKKVSKSAVVRHRYQRWLRRVASKAIVKSPAINCDVVLVVLPNIVTLGDLSELENDIQDKFSIINEMCSR